MNKRTLLLDSSYQVINFITFRKVLKLIFKEDKVDVISNWPEFITWDNGKIPYPSVLRLKNYIKKSYFHSNFSRKSLVKRDLSSCQYCNKKLSISEVTIDHVIPKSQGGKTSFSNCVVACWVCNNKKADMTPELAGMLLIRKAEHPSFFSSDNISDSNQNLNWNSDWNGFLAHNS